MEEKNPVKLRSMCPHVGMTLYDREEGKWYVAGMIEGFWNIITNEGVYLDAPENLGLTNRKISYRWSFPGDEGVPDVPEDILKLGEKTRVEYDACRCKALGIDPNKKKTETRQEKDDVALCSSGSFT